MKALRFISVVFIAGLLSACGTVPRDTTWTGAYFPQATYVPSPQPTMYVGSMLMHVGALGGSPTQAVYGQVVQPWAQNSIFQGMLPDTAQKYLDKLNAMDPKPCSAGDHMKRTSIGTFIGLLLGQAVGGNTQATLWGGLIGALGGNASAQMTCDRWTFLQMQFQLVIDQQNRCSGEVRRVNGVTTSDEHCAYARRYTPNHQPPQIGR